MVLLFMLPPANPQAASRLTQHYLNRVRSQLPGPRSLGLTGLLALLRHDESEDEVNYHVKLTYVTDVG